MKRNRAKSASILTALVLTGMLLCGQDKNPEQPRYRLYHDLVYHDSTNQVYLFGGVPSHGWSGELKDVWSFDPASKRWVKIGTNKAVVYVNPIGGKQEVPAQSPAWDSESNRIIFLNRAKKTWAFSPEAGTWKLMSPELFPPARCGQSSVYDSESDRIILFGGFECKNLSGPFYSDVWAYDYNTDTWEDMNPVSGPEKRAYASMVYNPVNDRVMMWGGRQLDNIKAGFSDNSMWEYDYNSNTWTEIVSKGGPELPYAYADMIYHHGNNEIYMFGGGPMDGTFSGYNKDESWIYSFADSSWTLIPTENTPPQMSNHSMVYNPESNEIVLFGGETGNMMYTDTKVQGTWYYDYESNSWSENVFAYAGQDAIFCASNLEQIILGGSPTAWGGVEPYDYSWSGEALYEGSIHTAADLLDTTGAANPGFISLVDSLSLFLEVTDAMGSVGRDTVNVRFSIFDVCMDDWREYIIEGDSIQLAHCIEGGLGPLSYSWLPEENLSDPNASDPWASPASSGTFKLTVTDTAGCEMTSAYTVDVHLVNVDQNSMNGSVIKILADPASHQITIQADNRNLEPLSLQILSITGAVMDQLTFHPGISKKNLSNYTSGVYLYRLSNNNVLVESGKFIFH